MTAFFIGLSTGLIVGFIISGLLFRKQIGDKITYEIEKLRAKKGGVIKVDQDNETRQEKRAARKAARKSN